MRYFFQYIWQRRAVLAVFAGCALIFVFSFILYHLPLMAVVYPVGLSALLMAAYTVSVFVRAWNKHKKLEYLRNLPDDLPELLAVYQGQEDIDYCVIIRLLCEREMAYHMEMRERTADILDYYTMWAHQVKTPIAAMHLILQNEDSPLSRRLSEEVFRIEQYVEMVLTYLRLDSEDSDYVFREHSLDAIVRQSVKKFAGQFIRCGIRLDYIPDERKITTDDKWLSFVIEQILSNALKYTHTGSITIEVEEPCTLCIRDTGIGIAKEDLPRIFEKGYTGYNGRTDKRASGLGLYLCSRICKNLGYEISVQSAVDEGTVVRVELGKD